MQVLKNDLPENEKRDIKNLLLATRNFKKVLAVCQDAMTNQKLIGISGGSGLGKSIALRHFQKTNKNVFYLTVDPSMTAKDFWGSLFDSLPESDRIHFGMNTRRALYFILKAVAGVLNSYEKCLLIIDEGGKLSPRMLEFLHTIRDATSETTGIVLAGPPYFKRNMTNWVRSERTGMPEVWRRINYWEELYPIDRHEIKEFCRHFGVVDLEVVRRFSLECNNFGELSNRITEYYARDLTL